MRLNHVPFGTSGVLALLASTVCHVPAVHATQAPGSGGMAIAGHAAAGAVVPVRYGKIPMAFEANRGQAQQGVRFLSRGRGYTLFLTGTQAVLSLRASTATSSRQETHSLAISLAGSNPRPRVDGVGRTPGHSNYYIGNDRKAWHEDVPLYAKVRYENVYPGINVVYYGSQRNLEHDFVVTPGADPHQIRLQFNGLAAAAQARGERLDRSGNLLLDIPDGQLEMLRPTVYQQSGGVRRPIQAGYRLEGPRSAGFWLGAYDRSKPLIIDPVLTYSTYLGGSGDDIGNGIAIDTAGDAFIVGTTTSANLPAANNGYTGLDDAFVSRLSPDGSTIVFSTYLGGVGDDLGNAIALDRTGNPYITGSTKVTGNTVNNFPVTLNAFQQTAPGGQDAFFIKLNPSGVLQYSTYLGGAGSDSGNGIAIDAAGSAYITGSTTSGNFPTAGVPLFSAQQGPAGTSDAFVTKINANGAAPVYSTYLGGFYDDFGKAVAVDGAGRACVTGYTANSSTTTPNNFPTSNGLPGPSGAVGGRNAFVSVLDPAGSTLFYSTLIGSTVEGDAITTDPADNIYVAGVATSTFVTSSAAQGDFGGGLTDAFVEKIDPNLNPDQAAIYATFIGGPGNNEAGRGIAVDAMGYAQVVGFTDSATLGKITTNAFQGTSAGMNDAFVAKLSPDGSTFTYLSFLGGSQDDFGYGIALDGVGNAYVTGSTTSVDFPKAGTPAQAALKAGSDAFVAEISDVPEPPETFTGIAVSATENDLTFSDLSNQSRGATNAGYALSRAPVSNGVVGTFITIAMLDGNATSYQDTGLTPGAYAYQLIAINAYGTSSPPSQLIVPLAPKNLTVTPVLNTPGSLTLTYTDATKDATGIEIFRQAGTSGPFVLVSTPPAPANGNPVVFTDSGLNANSTYTYKIRAINQTLSTAPLGISLFTSTVSATTVPNPPAAPTNLALTALQGGNGTVQLTWQNNDTSATSINVLRHDGDNVPTNPAPFVIIATLTPTSNSYLDTDLGPNHQVTYLIQAANAGGANPQPLPPASRPDPLAAVISTLNSPPTAPSALTLTALSSTSIQLSFINTSQIAQGFHVYRATVAGGVTGAFSIVGGSGGSPYIDQNNLAANTTYTYFVTAYDAGGDSPPSNQATVTTPIMAPGAPGTLVASLPAVGGQTTVNLAFPDTNADATSFTIQRQIGTGNFSPIATLPATGGTTNFTYQDSGLTPNTLYGYQVVANNAGGPSAPSNTATITTLPNPPVAPKNLTATATSTTTIQLTFDAGDTSQTGFNILRRDPTTGVFTLLATVAGTATSYIDTGLTVNTTYTYEVEATNLGGSSPPAGPVSATTLPNMPLAPGNLTATTAAPPAGSTEIDLTFTDTNTDFTGFNIERQTGAGPFTLVTTITAAPGPPSFSYADKNLTPGTTYTYRVFAENASGGSPASNTATATTSATAPAAPSNLKVTGMTGTTVSLSFTSNSTTQTGFKIQRAPAPGGVVGTFATVATTGPTTTTYTDMGLAGSTMYAYQVVATNGGGDSAPSNQVQVTTLTPTAAPTGLTATLVAPSEIDLSFTDTNNDFTGFIIQRQVGTGPFTQVASPAAAPGASPYTYKDTTATSPSTTYTYEVIATGPAGPSSPSNTASATTPAHVAPPVPPAPTALTATPVSQSEIDLSWTEDPNGGATGFKIQRSTDGTNFSLLAVTSAAKTTFADMGLTPNTKYYYLVLAIDAAGDSPPSNIANATTLPNPPSAPINLTTTVVSSSEIDLAFTSGSSDTTGLIVQRKAGAGAFTNVTTLPATATSFNDTGLTPNTSYTYQVVGTNAGGSSNPSNQATATTLPAPPAAPTALTATAASGTEIDLAFTDTTGDATAFIVQRQTGTGPFTTITPTPLAATARTFADTGLTPNTAYNYQVLATNAGGTSVPSNAAGATTLPNAPAAPTNLSATTPAAPAGQTEIDLAFTDTTGDETGFIVKRQSGTGAFTAVNTTPLPVGTTSFKDTGLTPATTYNYQVYAVNPGGSTGSNTASAATLPTSPVAPSGLVATGISNSQVNLGWSDNSSNEASFKIQRQDTTGGAFNTIATVGANVTTYSDTTVTGGATYTYQVIASNAGGDSPPSNQSSVTTAPNPPTGAVSLSATAPSSTQVNLTFSTTAAGITSIVVQRQTGTGGGTYSTVTTLGPTATSFTDTNLSPGSTYTYQVQAQNGGGSISSNPATVTTLPNAPLAPTGLMATPRSQNEIDLAWTDNNADFTGFIVQRQTAGAGPFVNIATLGAGITTYADTALTQGVSYTYQVVATNAGGNSPPSNQVTASTLATVPAAASNLAATAVSATTINLTWTDNSTNETGFKIVRKSGAAAFSLLATVGPNVTSYSDTTVTTGITYTYQVVATNGTGDAPPSNNATASTSGTGSISGSVSVTAGAVTAPLTGVTVQLLDSTGTTLQTSTQTSANGTFAFNNVPAATYTVAVVPQPGQTAPPNQVVAAPANGTATGINFTLTPAYVFTAGVTMVSIPYDYSGNGLNGDASLLFGTPLVATYIQAKNNNYYVYPQLPDSQDGKQVIPGRGYWIKETAAQPFHNVGNPTASPYSLQVFANWNEIGDPFTSNVDLGTVMLTVPVAVGTNAANQPMTYATATGLGLIDAPVYHYNPNNPSNQPYDIATTLQPFLGYWLHVNAALSQGQPVTLTFTRAGQ